MQTPVQLEPFSKNGTPRLLARPHPIELARGLGFSLWGVALGVFAVATAFTDQNTVFMSGLKTLFCVGAGALAVEALTTGLRHIMHYRHSVLMISDQYIATLSGAAGIVRAYPRTSCHAHDLRYSWLGKRLNYGLIRIDDPNGHHLIGLPLRNPDYALMVANAGEPQPVEAHGS